MIGQNFDAMNALSESRKVMECAAKIVPCADLLAEHDKALAAITALVAAARSHANSEEGHRAALGLPASATLGALRAALANFPESK